MSFSIKSGLFSATIALLGASSAQAALVQVDVSGTYSGIVFPIGTVLDEPYSGTFIYDSDAPPISTIVYPLESYSDNIFTAPQPGTVTLRNDFDTGTSIVDRLEFYAEFSNQFGHINSGTTLDFANDFLPPSGLPSLNEFSVALNAGKFVSGEGQGAGQILDTPLGHASIINAVSVGPVPEPASLSLLGAIGVIALRRKEH